MEEGETHDVSVVRTRIAKGSGATTTRPRYPEWKRNRSKGASGLGGDLEDHDTVGVDLQHTDPRAGLDGFTGGHHIDAHAVDPREARGAAEPAQSSPYRNAACGSRLQ